MKMRRFSERAALLGVCLAIAATLASGASATTRASAGGSAATPFRVLVFGPFSGVAASFGAAYSPGIVAAAQLVNKSGGILGHPITIKVLDDQSNPAVGVGILQNELAGGTKYNLVITANTAFTQPYAPLLAQQDVLVESASSATAIFRGTPYSNLFGFAFDLYSQEQGVVRQMVKMHVKNVGIIAANNAAGTEAAGYLAQYAKNAGITTHTVLAPPTVPDATPQLQQLQGDGAKALAVIGFSALIPTALAARAKLGWTDPAFCDAGCAATNWANVPAASLANFYVEEMPWFVSGTSASASKQFKLFYTATQKRSSTFPLGIVVPLIGYDEILAARAAATKAHSIDGSKMVSALESIHTASGIPYWTGPLELFNSTVVNGYDLPHVNHTVSGDFVFVKAKPQVNGMIAGPLVGG